jgi:tRNA (cmo5U34)-methyltransferase
MRHTNRIKTHFDNEAREFDNIILRLVPYYPAMIEALALSVCLDRGAPVEVIDLGCGTGTSALEILKHYPHASMTCMDLSAKMLDIARYKLREYPDVRFEQGSFADYLFDRQYDLAVSSLALHHIETLDEKLEFYRRIYNALAPGGVFVNADIVLGSSDRLQDMYLERWKNFMLKKVPADEIENTWINKYHDEDRPEVLTRHLAMMSECGFGETDVVWKYYNFAVYRGRR